MSIPQSSIRLGGTSKSNCFSLMPMITIDWVTISLRNRKEREDGGGFW